MSATTSVFTKSGNLSKYCDVSHFGLNGMAMRTIETNLRNLTISHEEANHALMFYNIYNTLKTIASQSDEYFTTYPTLYEQYKFLWDMLGAKPPSPTYETTDSE
jgi:hypothetical protein